MPVAQIAIVDCTTGEVSYVDPSPAEIAEAEALAVAWVDPASIPTQSEQIGQIVAEGKAQIAAAGNDTGKAIQALVGVLDGLGRAFGSGA